MVSASTNGNSMDAKPTSMELGEIAPPRSLGDAASLDDGGLSLADLTAMARKLNVGSDLSGTSKSPSDSKSKVN